MREEILSRIQKKFPLVAKPFEVIAEVGIMRRFASILNHRKAGFNANAIIEDIASEIESKSHMPLYSSKEFKKVRIEYFTPAFKEWEEKYKNISKES